MKTKATDCGGVLSAFSRSWAISQIAFLAGGVAAATQVFSRRFVLEFQSGQTSSFTERLLAVAQQATIEGIGFGILVLVCGLLGWLFSRPVARWLDRAGDTSAGGTIGGFLFLGSFAIWTMLAPLTEDALPFLRWNEILGLNLAALVICFVALAFHLFLAMLMPGKRDLSPAAMGFVSVLLACLGVYYGLEIFLHLGRGLGSFMRITLACLPMLFSLVAVAPVSRMLTSPLGVVGKRIDSGWPFPRPLTVVTSIAFGSSFLATVGNLKLSGLERAPDYASLAAPGAPVGPNVVLVTVDTLRADHLGAYGYDRPTSPFLDSLAAEGVRCADVAAAAAWTKPATGTILTGLYPSRHGALYHGSTLRLPQGERTLAEAFRDAGYVTAAFVSNPNIKRVFRFDRGFMEFFDSPVEDSITLAALRGALIGRIATDLLRYQFNWKYENDVRTMNQHVFGWLEHNHASRFFAYIHYIDPHIPYSPPEPYLSQFDRKGDEFLLFNERKKQVGVDRYDGEIAYTDEGLRELVDELKHLNAWENTLFILTADHGEEFFEHGVLGHGYSLFQPVVRVPLLFHGPGVSAGKVIQQPVQVLDLPATVLDLAETGVDTLGDGHSIASLVRGLGAPHNETIFLENEFGKGAEENREFVMKGVRRGPWKLVFTEANAYFPPDSPEGTALALYNLDSDPFEEHNVFGEEANRRIVTELRALLEEHLLFLQETGFRTVAPTAISEDIQRNLDALGY